uniref:Putative secreted protein n=1 Tax=Anopheles darlingi TaxID=43151 RepID=A0A2M4D074_ANODA
MMCFLVSCRLLMLKQLRSAMLRLATGAPLVLLLPLPPPAARLLVTAAIDCLNFFSLSKYSSRAHLSGVSPYTTKYFFRFVFSFRWYPCSTMFNDSGRINCCCWCC